MEKKNIIEISIFVVVMLIATCIKECAGYNSSKLDELRDSLVYYSVSTSFESYVFVDKEGFTHTSSTCRGIARHGYSRETDTIRLDSIKESNTNRICSRCVSGDQLNRMIEIINK